MRRPPKHLSSTDSRRPRHGHHATPHNRHSPQATTPPVRGKDRRGRADSSKSSDCSPTAHRPPPSAAPTRARDLGAASPARALHTGDRPAAEAKHRDRAPRPQNPRTRSRSPRSSSKLASARRLPFIEDRSPCYRPVPDSAPTPRDCDHRDGFPSPEAQRARRQDAASVLNTNAAPIQDAPQPNQPLSSATSKKKKASLRLRSVEPRRERSRRELIPSTPSGDIHTTRLRPYILDQGTHFPQRDLFSPRDEAKLSKDETSKPQSRRFRGRKRQLSPRPGQDAPENSNRIAVGIRHPLRRASSPKTEPDDRHRSRGSEHWAPSSLQGGRSPPASDRPSSGQRAAGPSSDKLGRSPSPAAGALRHEQWRLPSPRKRATRTRNRHRQGQPASSTTTGANSIEINMSGRGSYRGSYGGQYPVRGHYNQSPNDSRSFSHSSSHATSSSSYQASPPPQSSYSSSRGSWGGQQQSSSQGSVSAHIIASCKIPY